MRNQKVAVVTGASSGFGELRARLLAESGFKVFGTSRRSGAIGSGVEMLLLPRRRQVATHQEPGESARGADVIRQTPCRPPGGHTGVGDDVSVNRVLKAMASQRANDQPCAPPGSRTRTAH